MKISFRWIQDYVRYEGTAHELSELLQRIGMGLEEFIELEDDVCLDLEISSNRNDLNGMLGVAREIAAATGAELRLPPVSFSENDEKVEDRTQIDVLDPELCPRYVGRVIRGVKMGPSPEWMQQRLEVIGLRPINNVVDITNFVLYETCQPLHTFDSDTLEEGRIVVRKARDDETMTAIDGSECDLKPEMLVIADAARPVAVAGVMGGKDTEVSETTTNLLLESACFDPISVRRTARGLGLATDSSYRFEHGIDPVGVDFASRRAAHLIQELAGGDICRGSIDVGSTDQAPRKVSVRIAQIPRVLGLQVSPVRTREILASLELNVIDADDAQVTVRVPSFRPDLEREIDLIEEVARMEGLDKIPDAPNLRVQPVEVQPHQRLESIVHTVLTGAGFDEIATVSFLPEKIARQVSPWSDGPVITTNNTIRKEENALRRSLFPHLVQTRKTNQDRGHHSVKLYEISHVYLRETEGAESTEKRVLSFLHDEDFRSSKGVIELLIERLKLPETSIVSQDSDVLDKGTSAVWKHGERILGCLGTVGPALLKQFDLKQAPSVAEIDLDAVQALARFDITLRPLPKYPATDRDIALVVPEEVTWEQIVRTIQEMKLPLLESVDFFDLYRGKGIDKGSKSIAFRLVFRSSDRTLTNDEIDKQRATIATHLEGELRGKVR